MNVGCARINRVGNQPINRADDRRIAYDIAQPLQIILVRACTRHFGVELILTVKPVNPRLNIAWRRDDAVNRAGKAEPKRGHRKIIKRIGHSQSQSPVRHRHGQRAHFT